MEKVYDQHTYSKTLLFTANVPQSVNNQQLQRLNTPSNQLLLGRFWNQVQWICWLVMQDMQVRFLCLSVYHQPRPFSFVPVHAGYIIGHLGGFSTVLSFQICQPTATGYRLTWLTANVGNVLTEEKLGSLAKGLKDSMGNGFELKWLKASISTDKGMWKLRSVRLAPGWKVGKAKLSASQWPQET